MRIFESGVAIATSELLRVELAEAAFAIALKERCYMFVQRTKAGATGVGSGDCTSGD